jgi:hypothetical protein
MSTAYETSPRQRPVASLAFDDVWGNPRDGIDVIVTDDRTVDTGLLDQHGNRITRRSARVPLGFCR